MSKSNKTLPKILIVDDSDMNRSLLADILENDFDILEACNGVEAINFIRSYGVEISLVLLDIVMPRMDGFAVLSVMNSYKWIQDIPVIIISADNSSSAIARAYELGATDYIQRPFDATVVSRRVQNAILLYGKQRRLERLVEEHIREKEQEQALILDILGHVVDFRNGESESHVLHVHTITRIILQGLLRCTDKYKLTSTDVRVIATASALRDIGNIVIGDEILNKKKKLTAEETEIIRQHPIYGYELLSKLPQYGNAPLLKTAKDICRWHHERYDGKGYPDGLKGDEIPISAQVVALADVYDSLTNKRAGKRPVSHNQAMEMILNGEYGTFNPILLNVLNQVADQIRDELYVNAVGQISLQYIRHITQEAISNKELVVSKRALELLEHEREKYCFIASLTNGIIFEIFFNPTTVNFLDDAAKFLGLDTDIFDPMNDVKLLACFGKENMEILHNKILSATHDDDVFSLDVKVIKNDNPVYCNITMKVQFVFNAKNNEYIPNSAIGKLSFNY